MARIRIGVVGCGLIGQMMHLPHLKELHEVYELVALCDVSPGTLKYVADYYGVSKRHTDHHALMAGKHVFTEKPMCFNLREADEILAAHKRAGTVCMVAYMKRYDPGFRY